jgi:hypothetical protein
MLQITPHTAFSDRSPCAHCGKPIAPKQVSRRQKFCSYQCRDATRRARNAEAVGRSPGADRGTEFPILEPTRWFEPHPIADGCPPAFEAVWFNGDWSVPLSSVRSTRSNGASAMALRSSSTNSLNKATTTRRCRDELR